MELVESNGENGNFLFSEGEFGVLGFRDAYSTSVRDLSIHSIHFLPALNLKVDY